MSLYVFYGSVHFGYEVFFVPEKSLREKSGISGKSIFVCYVVLVKDSHNLLLAFNAVILTNFAI